jgi:Predicted phosphatases
MSGAATLLTEILKTTRDLRKQNLKSLVVFDLDSTLFDVSPRLERILLDFAAIPVNKLRFPEQIAKLHNIKTERKDWGIKNALQRAGLDGHHPEFQEAVFSYWQKNFFSNHYLQFDVPYEGAVEYTQALHQAGARIVYLTGRDVERMGVGSREVLLDWKFPLDENAELVLKPHRSMDDAEFKADWFLTPEASAFSKVYFFENEPVNLNLLKQRASKVEMIFFESTHAGKQQPPIDIPKVMDFLCHLDEA